MSDAPALRDEGQQETIGGLLGELQRFVKWTAAGGWTRMSLTLFGLVVMGAVAAILFFQANPQLVVSAATAVFGNDIEEALVEERRIIEGKRVDNLICAAVERLRVRHGAARAVTRAFAYDNGRFERIGVEDVCEINDARARQIGLKDLPLPIEAIEPTINYMIADPNNLRCVAKNRADHAGEKLRTWMADGELESSVACLVADLSVKPLGLLAVSLRRPVEEAPTLERDVRDVSLLISGYWEQSFAVQAAIARIKAREE